MNTLPDDDIAISPYRWDFVTDPPTRLLADLQAARDFLDRGQLREAEHAARRLLRNLEAKIPNARWTVMPVKLAELRCDGIALRAIAAALLGKQHSAEMLDRSLEAFRQFLAEGHTLRPPSSARYGTVLALAGHEADAVEPLVRAMEAGERVHIEILRAAGRRLVESRQIATASQLLRALHQRYPRVPALAVDLARICDATGDPDAAAEAHVAAAALCADEGRYDLALEHFDDACRAVADHPLAALGRCQALLALGRPDEALDALEHVRTTQPHLAGTHAVAALALAHSEQLEAALQRVDDALTAFPEDAWLMDSRVRLLLRSGDTGAALAAVEDALEVDPNDREWRSLRAQLLLHEGGDVDAALDELRELAETDRDNAAPTVRLARALCAVGRQARAVDVVERGLLERPDEPSLWELQLELLNALGRADEAVTQAQQALTRGVPRDSVVLPLAEALLALGRDDEAISAADEALARDGASLRAHRVRGLAAQHLGDYGEAQANLEPVLQADGSDEQARVAMAASLTRRAEEAARTDPAEGRRLLEHAVELDPRNVTTRLHLAELLRRAGEQVAALRHADLGLEQDPDNARLLGTRGQILQAMEQNERAEADLRRAVELDQGLAWAQAELGDLLRTRKQFRPALAHLERAIEARRDDPWPWASKGAALYALDLYDEAIESLDTSLGLQPDYAWAHCVKGAVLMDVDQLAAARRHLDRGLALDSTMGWAWGVRAWLHLLEGGAESTERAERAYGKARDRGDGYMALVGLAEAAMLQERKDEAAQHLRDAVTLLQGGLADDPGMYAALGWCKLRLGEHDDAVDALVRAIALDTSHIAAAFDLALALLCARRGDVAVEEYSQAAARLRSVRHPGRRRSLIRVARRDLEALARDQLEETSNDLQKVRKLLDTWGGSDAGDRPGVLQMPGT